MTGSRSNEKPGSDEVEVTLIGPGFGECCLVHLTNNTWVIVDSCLDSRTGSPAALGYLQKIGVDIKTDVKLVVITHFHDDHIKGISEVFEKCESAVLCISAAMSKDEFVTYVTRFESQMLASGSGVSEMSKILHIAEETGRKVRLGSADKRIHHIPSSDGIKPECNVWTLSPSDTEIQRFLSRIGEMLPNIKQTKYRSLSSHLNDFSVVTLIEIDDLCVLLGADLEQRGSKDRGWKAVVSSAGRPQKVAEVFKVAHHGSATGHNDDVWTKMLQKDAYSLMTPWTLAGSRLPKADDIKRINAKTPRAYITSHLHPPASKVRRPRAVEKTIKEQNVKLRQAQPGTGSIRLRRKVSGGRGIDWDIRLYGSAARLSGIT